ncbi:MAG: aminoacyl-tRNA hydrolase [Pseudomonadota bacterium]
MPEKRVCLIAGLGNPGNTYAKTRHNAGFMVIDALADTFSIPVEKKKFETIYGRGLIEGINVILTKPVAFMNKSGLPVYSLSNFYKILQKDILIIYDDIDLAFGRIKINQRGGSGGHKGMISLINSFGSDNISRIRIGIGRSESGTSISNYVLDKFSAKEKDMLNLTIKTACDAAVTILYSGIEEAMNRFNDKRNIL